MRPVLSAASGVLRPLIGLALCAATSSPALASTLRIEIGNVRNAAGHVHIDVCPEAHFLKDDCPYSAEAAARPGVTIVTVTNLPPGRYAVQAFHDENDNHKVDRMVFGIPKEGVGFSNDARISLGPPKFLDAAFTHGVGEQTISLRMRYWSGASGPAVAASR
ncbi:DUF2141 domain-containing protein [Flavisphingomonas formosensis]|uniref:DUF2141 domain-containing protein n=1 Tax=Flavisphingomonas formosensis TaxID=861534 RepID=UPI0012FB8F20|nr:DUF2141 domain-containing protein [Sphingomonas formosensis]